MLKSKKGFTMLELIVSLGFVTIIFLLLFNMKAGVDQVEKATSYELDNANAANLVLSDFQSDFKSSEYIFVSADKYTVAMIQFNGDQVKWHFDIATESIVREYMPLLAEPTEKVYVEGDLNTTAVGSSYFTVDDPLNPQALNVNFNLGEVGTTGNDYSGTYHINSDLNQELILQQ